MHEAKGYLNNIDVYNHNSKCKLLHLYKKRLQWSFLDISEQDTFLESPNTTCLKSLPLVLILFSSIKSISIF